jgi:Ni,Fe-hydrogenase I cytochrome b subunit
MKNWVIKIWHWLKKNCMQIINLIVLFIAYAYIPADSAAGNVVGFWIFILLAYYIFWKLFGMGDTIKNYLKQRN